MMPAKCGVAPPPIDISVNDAEIINEM